MDSHIHLKLGAQTMEDVGWTPEQKTSCKSMSMSCIGVGCCVVVGYVYHPATGNYIFRLAVRLLFQDSYTSAIAISV